MTIKVITANPTAHEPEKPKTEKQSGKAQDVLGQISPCWYSTFRSVTLSSPWWDRACGWLAEQMGSPSLKFSVMWKGKDQNTATGYAQKELGCERTWKAVPVTDFMFSEGSPQLLKQLRKVRK